MTIVCDLFTVVASNIKVGLLHVSHIVHACAVSVLHHFLSSLGQFMSNHTHPRSSPVPSTQREGGGYVQYHTNTSLGGASVHWW